MPRILLITTLGRSQPVVQSRQVQCSQVHVVSSLGGMIEEPVVQVREGQDGDELVRLPLCLCSTAATT